VSLSAVSPIAAGGKRRDHWALLNEAKARIQANSGGPMSRRRTERVQASLLRRDGGPLRLPRVIHAGLRFDESEPIRTVLERLARVGLDDAESLRSRFAVPAVPLLARVVPDAAWCVPVASASDDAVLEQALLLGLCTAYQYDPARPVLWTRSSLTRCVVLHDAAGFYA
jgi:hypothetical protein